MLENEKSTIDYCFYDLESPKYARIKAWKIKIDGDEDGRGYGRKGVGRIRV